MEEMESGLLAELTTRPSDTRHLQR